MQQGAQLNRMEQPAGMDRTGRPRRRRISSEQKRRMEAERKSRKRKLFLERFSFTIIIVLLLFLYLDARIQLKEVTAAASAAAAAIKQEPVQKEDVSSLETAPVKSHDEPIDVNYVNQWGMDTVDKPIQRDYDEVLKKLRELAEENEIIEEIIKNPKLYPEKLLEALANNPEMADFVRGYPKSDGTAEGGLTESETEQDFPLFLQWDPRWGYVSYGDNSNIAVSGCGPVSLSMALYYLTGDETLTPDKLADYSMKNGYYVSGTGTAWALITDVPLQYGIGVAQPGIEESAMKQELDKGNVLIASMKPGDFTAAGHFLVIYGYDKNGFKVNDPNCVARSRQSWTFNEIGRQIKSLWSLGEETAPQWRDYGTSDWTQTIDGEMSIKPGSSVSDYVR